MATLVCVCVIIISCMQHIVFPIVSCRLHQFTMNNLNQSFLSVSLIEQFKCHTGATMLLLRTMFC